ncbi:GNAT family N-acetyltransferase [Gallaecimonas xiamenensis]|uniref:Acetyltransferase n=1 Tax=Gallaecimonas xiamenensis 3-C-1 TaxID=745411 RepID=K2J125_9GAMM|nr:GNAT family N-acetyltransferase [Gallaecimonas xiamenensis]EKE76611.1 acetyltransferase [Gallaecimonas xiamenensis 3-C-1]
MQLVPAKDEDHGPMLALWERSVRATHDFLTEEDIAFFLPLILTQGFASVTLYCAKDQGGRLLGFVGVAGDKVEMLFVDDGLMGLGVGKALMALATSQLGASRVDVNEQNPQALGFYLHLGFKVVARSPLDSMGKAFPILHLAL